MALNANAEGGVNGVTVTAADTGSGDPWTTVVGPGTSGIVQYSNALVANGTLAYRIATRATSETVYTAWTNATAAATWYGRFYFAIDVNTSGSIFHQMRQSAGGGILAYINFNSSNKVVIAHGNNTASAYTFTNTFTVGQWYRVEYLATAGGATGTVQARFYLGNSTTLIEDSGAVTVNQSTSFTTWQYGRYGVSTANPNFPSSTGYIYFDDVQAFATGFPGPAVSASQFARPSSDVTAAGWTPSTGTSLFATIDESSPSDTDYISSPSSRLWTPAPKRVLRPHDDLPRRRKVLVPCR